MTADAARTAGEACSGRGRGGLIARVEPGSAAQAAGLRPGDCVLAVDGEPVRDVVDWRWLTGEPSFVVSVRPEGGGAASDVTVTREPGEPLGVDFADVVFDGVRLCRNACTFCFVRQLPPGLRRGLYVRDDDFRLSFLGGNFITLTNLDDADVSRIAEQRLSPLYVSLHAVDPLVRARLVCAAEDRALERFDELLEAGIELHVQIVLVPGVNDGEVLDGTLTWLAEREGVLSVGIVPLGYTRYQQVFTASFQAPDAARDVLARVSPWQEAFRARYGQTWVQCADELHLSAGLPLPPAEHYDGYPQYENGIGMVRAFLDEWAEALPAKSDLAARGSTPAATVVTGTLFAPVARPLVASLGGTVLAVENRFFGGDVSVTGLLTGEDLVEAIAAHASPGPFLVPDVVVNEDGLLLDDVPGAELGQRSGKTVRLVSCDAASLVAELLGESATNPP